MQIGDITRQRLDHAEYALGLVPREGKTLAGGDRPVLAPDQQRLFIQLADRLRSAQLKDAAREFDRDVGQIAVSLSSLGSEAQVLRAQGDTAYGSTDRDGGTVISELEGQIRDALDLFEAFETARVRAASMTATVSAATASLRGHLQTVQALEADIRIMGLNTTFKCARVGLDGVALSVIAQELRIYANGFAKEADALMAEIESVTEMSASLIAGTAAEHNLALNESTRAVRDSLTTLRAMRRGLDGAMADLGDDSERVVALLAAAVTSLESQHEISAGLRDTAGQRGVPRPAGSFSAMDLTPPVEEMLALIERGYTMASERAVHDRVLGRESHVARVTAITTPTELADMLF